MGVRHSYSRLSVMARIVFEKTIAFVGNGLHFSRHFLIQRPELGRSEVHQIEYDQHLNSDEATHIELKLVLHHSLREKTEEQSHP